MRVQWVEICHCKNLWFPPCSSYFSSPTRYYFMAIQASILSAWCQQCCFLLLKSLMLSPLFSSSLSFSLLLHLPCHHCVYFLSDNFISSGMVPFDNERKHEILKLVFYFPFIACPLYFILVLFKIIFFCIFMTCLKTLYIFFAQLHINDHFFVPLYCILLWINKVFWGKWII